MYKHRLVHICAFREVSGGAPLAPPMKTNTTRTFSVSRAPKTLRAQIKIAVQGTAFGHAVGSPVEKEVPSWRGRAEISRRRYRGHEEVARGRREK